MMTKNKLLIAGVLLFGMIFQVQADANRDTLLSDISKLESNLTTLKTTKSADLEKKVFNLSSDYDAAFTSMWYDSKVVSYLVGLGKLNSNFKQDMGSELNTLNTEISTKVATELSTLAGIKNNILLNYPTVNEADKTKLSASIATVSKNYSDLDGIFTTKINTLYTKYSSSLASYKSNLKTAYDNNSTQVAALKNFNDKYNDLYNLNVQFESNYTAFKDSYLAYAGDLSVFSEQKQAFYVEMLRKELEGLRDANLKSNPTLVNYKNDIDRLITILLENFKNSLQNNMAASYGVIYSESDINSLRSRFQTIKNRYYDVDGNMKVSEVIGNSGAILEVTNTRDKLSTVNTNIKDLLGGSNAKISYENVKIRLENEMIKYYNANYTKYREDLIAELKQKLNFVAQDTKNMILAADNIDIRYNILNEKLKKMSDVTSINTEIKNFRQDINKYTYLNNATINAKVFKIDSNLKLYVINQELNQDKYSTLTFAKNKAKAQTLFTALKEKYPDTYKEKFQLIESRIDTALEKKLSTKNRFTLLSLKASLINFQNQ